MRVFTRPRALLGWIVARSARRRLERRLNELAGNRRRRPWLTVTTGLVSAALAAGAVVVRRSHGGGLGPA